MFKISLADIKQIAPHAQGEYLAAFASANPVLQKFELTTRLRACHFLAQILAETGGFRVFEESLDYSAPRLVQIWPNHFPDLAAAEPYAHNSERLGNYIYGQTSIARQLGNTQPGDGYRFRGRGLLQTTGRAAYAKFGTLLNIPLLDDPTLAYNHNYALSLAAAEFSASSHNGSKATTLSDMDDIVGVTWAVNGGQNGIEARKFWLERVKAHFATMVADAADEAGPGGDIPAGASRAIVNAGLEAAA